MHVQYTQSESDHLYPRRSESGRVSPSWLIRVVSPKARSHERHAWGGQKNPTDRLHPIDSSRPVDPSRLDWSRRRKSGQAKEKTPLKS